LLYDTRVSRDTTVFISYARADGESYAEELSQRLKSLAGIDLWRDRVRMDTGDFEQQIMHAIESSRYMAVVMTPEALRSKYVEKEYLYARKNGVCICPIKPNLSESERSELSLLRKKLPRWMQQIQVFDFDRYWDRFVSVLQSPCQAVRVPFQAPTMPANFVRRPAELSRIIAGVLDAERKNPSGGTVVLYGSGGFGKTSLAASICQDEDVFAACDGGILWATVGPDRNLRSELTNIYAALTGDRPPFATDEDAMFAVEQKIEGKRCLIVIDDVWERARLRPFLRGGEQSTRLITTRQADIAFEQADEPFRINVAQLQPDEAEAVLSARLETTPATRVRFRSLAQRLGEWPLLLQLANRWIYEQVARNATVERALDSANQVYDRLGVVAFDRRNAAARDEAIAKTVELSLSLLNGDRARCLELGIFPEDADVPLDVVAVVWEKDLTDTEILATRMDELALLKLDLSPKPGQAASRGSIRLHDAMSCYFAEQLSQPWLAHVKLADYWKDPKHIAAEYPLAYVACHLAATMADPAQVIKRARQFLDLLTDSRYREYQQRHGDPAGLQQQIGWALERVAAADAPDAPGLVVALALLRLSYAETERDPQLIFDRAAQGKIREAAERLELFQAEPEWDNLTRLLIAWTGASQMPAEAQALADAAAVASSFREVADLAAWVQTGAPPPSAAGRLAQMEAAASQRPDLPAYVAALLQRAGGAETPRGFEPINPSLLQSGLSPDASAFIAEQDGPVLAAFAARDRVSNTQYLERYIDIHAANRYRNYRNRSLWALLKSVLVLPDAAWVQAIVRRIVAAALSVTHVDFEEFLPLAVRGFEARSGNPAAAGELEAFRQRLLVEAPGLGPSATAGPLAAGPNDSWAHYQRRANALAEVYALTLDRPAEGAALLALARQLPKGFAGFRAFAALAAAESAQLVTPGDGPAIQTSLESAHAAAHRIQDYPFCLRATAMVNAMRSRWWSPTIDVEPVIDRFAADPLAAEFCAVHRVQEDFAFRHSDVLIRSLPIPDAVRNARTLREIASAYQRDVATFASVNPGIDPDRNLSRNDEVNIPEPGFVPILAARLAAAAMAAAGLAGERRSTLIQRLVPPVMTNRTALDTILARLLLSARNTAVPLPDLLRSLEVPHDSSAANASEHMIA